MAFSLTEFYAGLAAVARSFSEQTLIHGIPGPQTFAPLISRSDINAETLAKSYNYQNRKYFFSKPWEGSGYRPGELRWELPAIFVWPNITDGNRREGEHVCEWNMEFSLAFAVSMPDERSDEFAPVSFEERQEYLQALADSFFATCDDLSLYHVRITQAGFPLHPYLLDAAKSEYHGRLWLTDKELAELLSAGYVEEVETQTRWDLNIPDGTLPGAYVKNAFPKASLMFVVSLNAFIAVDTFPPLATMYPEALPVLEAGENAPPTPLFICRSDGLTVNFTNISSQGEKPFSGSTPNATFFWNFGDGQSANAENPTHTYGEEGSYNVIFTIGDGASSYTYSREITV